LFVSSTEADLFKALSPTTADKIGFYNNGVNTDYFVPSPDYPDPYPADIRPIVFTGAMDYWPNIDAVVWFSDKVFPLLQNLHPTVEFYIVGSNPSKAVLQLAKLAGVSVTGRVEDIRPYMQHAVAAVAPMRIARGVQNKVLESMAMAKPVVVSRMGLEGIEATHAQQVLIADSVDEYVATLGKLLTGDFAGMGLSAKQYVTQNFNWDNNLPEVVLLLGQDLESPLADRAVCNG
jgi:sugar transferase (PEP-CTERM/EpsH1 system associated)